jgi:hypothetical protein
LLVGKSTFKLVIIQKEKRKYLVVFEIQQNRHLEQFRLRNQESDCFSALLVEKAPLN